MAAQLTYLEDPELYELDAQIVRVQPGEGENPPVVFLDRTIFYPQGGGQPTDRGELTTASGKALVTAVSFHEGDVHHAVTATEGELREGEQAHLSVDGELRLMHAKLHTGGHLVMTAVDRLRKLPAVKGYHFPNGPYVEFDGVVPAEERDGFVTQVQAELDRLVAEDSEVTWRFDTVEALRAAGVHMPAETPEGKPTRVVITSGYVSPCGGTHVKKLGALTGLKVKGVKVKSGRTRVSYYIEGLG